MSKDIFEKEKTVPLVCGVSLFVLAAVFCIAIILGLFDFGTVSPSNRSAISSFGHVLVGAYGLCSLLIPAFFFTAGAFFLDSRWSVQRSVCLLISIIPFFTLVLAEKLVRSTLRNDIGAIAGVKSIIFLAIAAFFVAGEYLVALIFAGLLKKKYSSSVSEKKPDSRGDLSADELELLSHSSSRSEKKGSPEKNINVSVDSYSEIKREEAAKSEQEVEENIDVEDVDDYDFQEPVDIVDLDDQNDEKTEESPSDAALLYISDEESSPSDKNEDEEVQPFKRVIVADESGNPISVKDFSREEEKEEEKKPYVPKLVNEGTFVSSEDFDEPFIEDSSDSPLGAENNEREVPETKGPYVQGPTTSEKISLQEESYEEKPAPAVVQPVIQEKTDSQEKSVLNDKVSLKSDYGTKNLLDAADAALEQSRKSKGETVAIFGGLDKIFAQMDDDAMAQAKSEEKSNLDLKNEDSSEKSSLSLGNLAERIDSAETESDIDDLDKMFDASLTSEVSEDDKQEEVIQENIEEASAEDFVQDYSKEDPSDSNEDEDVKLENIAETEKKPEAIAMDLNKALEEKTDSEIQDEDPFAIDSSDDTFVESEDDDIFDSDDEGIVDDDELESDSLEEEEIEAPELSPSPSSRNGGPTAIVTDEKGSRPIELPPEKKTPAGDYKIPTSLLTAYDANPYWIIDEETQAAAKSLEATLSEFKISAEVTGIRKGPVVTMFEMLPAPGVKLSRIVALQDNIALRLAASSVRMIAPIPGKRAVGIEVPNKNRAIVSFRECIEQERPEWKKMAVPVILGKDIQGGTQIIDLVKTPHLLIAGSTGAGKSVCVNSMILSILYKRSPAEVKMILIDPKIVELKLYNDIPHLLTPVITEPKRAMQSLQYCLCEMERRYALLDGLGVRDISAYNKKIVEKHICTEKLPYLIVVIDEFADLMATTGKQLEGVLARLAAMSRAVGIHLVLATQRPSIDVITGLIKANIPSRIAFMVASKTDSRIIIDQTGAEKLLGKGDMLYASATDPFPVRIQGTFVSDQEVENVVNEVKAWGEPEYIDDEIFVDDDDEEGGESLDLMSPDGEDPLYEKALDIVVQAGKASASYIQRRLKIGYNRAARLVEEMEERGIVGPANGSKPREIIHIP